MDLTIDLTVDLTLDLTTDLIIYLTIHITSDIISNLTFDLTIDLTVDLTIEDAYGESPPPPAFLETPMWPNVVVRGMPSYRPCVPRIGSESLRGTCVGA